MHANRKGPKGHSEKIAIYKPKKEASGETNPVSTWTLDFYSPELQGNKFMLPKPFSL
jgi:hypothetical protein